MRININVSTKCNEHRLTKKKKRATCFYNFLEKKKKCIIVYYNRTIKIYLILQ